LFQTAGLEVKEASEGASIEAADPMAGSESAPTQNERRFNISDPFPGFSAF